MDTYAFQNCTGLTSIVVESGNTVFDSRNNCNAMIISSTDELIVGCQNTIIPNSVTSIGVNAFLGCTGLTSITIPNSVTSMGAGAFALCSGLTSITLSNALTSIPDGAFAICSSLTSVEIPSSVMSIGMESFEGCIGLTSITIPNSVTSIGARAFNVGSNLTKIKMGNATPVSISSDTFSSSANATLYVPRGSKSSYSSATNWSSFNAIKEYPDGDVNQDSKTDVVDVVDIARFVVGTPATSFDEFLADMNIDGSVTVADAIVLVNDIAGDTNFARKRAAASQNLSDNVLSLNGDGSSLSLQMEGNDRFAAFQFDLWLPSDMDVMQLSLNDLRRKGHQILYNRVGDGHYKVVALSTSGNAFNGTSGELLGITLDNFANDGVYMDNIHFVTPAGKDVPFEPVRVSHTTGIHRPERNIDTNLPLYNLNGQRIISPQKGLNIIGYKKIIVK